MILHQTIYKCSGIFPSTAYCERLAQVRKTLNSFFQQFWEAARLLQIDKSCQKLCLRAQTRILIEHEDFLICVRIIFYDSLLPAQRPWLPRERALREQDREVQVGATPSILLQGQLTACLHTNQRIESKGNQSTPIQQQPLYYNMWVHWGSSEWCSKLFLYSSDIK